MTIYASNIYGGGGGLPVGDKLRTGTDTTLTVAGATVLNLSTTAGVLHGVFITCALSSANTSRTIDSIKVTVDGASERTFTNTFVHMIVATSGLATNNKEVLGFYLPLPIRFADSLVVKIGVSNITGGDATAVAMYSVF